MNAYSDDTLRSLDPGAAALTIEERHRAEATLERIIASPSSAHARSAAPTLTRRAGRRLVLVPTAALALLVGAVLLQQDNGDRPVDTYASWTATPGPVASDELDRAASACRGQLEGSLDLGRAEVVLAERRGDHVALLYRTDEPDMSGACLVRNPQGSSGVDDVRTGAGGSTGPALEAPVRGFTQGAIAEFDRATFTDGAVGEGVKGVTIHARSITVTATVENGRYVAWWPGSAFGDSIGDDNPELILTYDLTLLDGTVLRNARPALPS